LFINGDFSFSGCMFFEAVGTYKHMRYHSDMQMQLSNVQKSVIAVSFCVLIVAGWVVLGRPSDTRGEEVKFTTTNAESGQYEAAVQSVEGSRITLYMGVRKSGGYTYRVDEVRKNGEMLNVYTTETAPGDSCAVTQALTYPAVTIDLGRPVSEDVRVHTTIKVKDC